MTLCLRDGREERFDGNPASRLEPEFRFFAGEIASADLKRCYELLDHSLMVSRMQTAARADAGIAFPCDE